MRLRRSARKREHPASPDAAALGHLHFDAAVYDSYLACGRLPLLAARDLPGLTPSLVRAAAARHERLLAVRR